MAEKNTYSNCNLFERIKKENICHFVMICKVSTKLKGGRHTSQYYLTAHKNDKEKLKGCCVYNSKHTGGGSTRHDRNLIDKELSSEEIKEFRRIKFEKYDCIVSDEDGQIWELKNNSFKDYYEKLKRN